MSHKPTFYPAKRRKLSVPTNFHDTLHDITNSADREHNVSKLSQSRQHRSQRQQPLKRLTKSEIASIAAKKREEVAQLRSRQRLRDSIRDLDMKIDELQKRDIPDIVYDIKKRRKMINSVLNSHDGLSEELASAKLEYDAIGTKLEAERETLRLSFEKELKDTSNKLETKLQAVATQWEEELAELDKIQPKDEVLIQINDLNEHLRQLEHELDLLRVSNEESVRERQEQLKTDLETLKNEKIGEQSKLVEEFNTEEAKKLKLSEVVDSTTLKISELQMIQSELQSQIFKTEKQVLENEREKEYPERRYKELTEELSSIEDKLTNLREKEILEGRKLSIERERLEEETLKRLRMENYIDNSRAHARIFGYIPDTTDQTLESFLEFRAQNGTIKKTEAGRLFELNRLISLEELSWWTKVWSPAMRYKIYIDACLEKGEDFNMFTVSTGQWSWDPQNTIMEYLQKAYSDRYSIKAQQLILSSKDNGDTKFTSDGTIQMDTEAVSLKNDTFESFSIAEVSNADSSLYIKILKFHFKDNIRDDKKGVHFYFVQLENNETLSLLRNLLWGKYPWNVNVLGIFIHTLLSFTHSCFLFNFCSVDKHIIRSMIQTAKKLSLVRDPFTTKGAKISK